MGKLAVAPDIVSLLTPAAARDLVDSCCLIRSSPSPVSPRRHWHCEPEVSSGACFELPVSKAHRTSILP